MPKTIRLLPSYETLHALLEYDPGTGNLTWKKRLGSSQSTQNFNAQYAGKIAGGLGSKRPDGTNQYLIVGFRMVGKQQQFGAHRVIFKMVTGIEPPPLLDHLDGDEFNNKWSNIRHATNGQNIQNSKIRKDNKSGVKGVSWNSRAKRWTAQINCDKRKYHLGRFTSIEAARIAIDKKRTFLHGEFARFC